MFLTHAARHVKFMQYSMCFIMNLRFKDFFLIEIKLYNQAFSIILDLYINKKLIKLFSNDINMIIRYLKSIMYIIFNNFLKINHKVLT